MTLMYAWAKFMKKVRGSAIVASDIHPTSKVEAGSQVVNSVFDRHSFCGYDCAIINCRIGSFCSIANGVTIGGARHPMEFVSTSPVFLSHKDSVKAKFARHHYPGIATTTIGHDVWIGERALIRAGVTVGHGAVIGMGSVVTKDVEPYAVVAGNPSKLIRMRFDPDTIRALLATQWWNLPDNELARVASRFDDVAGFLDMVRQR